MLANMASKKNRVHNGSSSSYTDWEFKKAMMAVKITRIKFK
jgi:hypothetical protein